MPFLPFLKAAAPVIAGGLSFLGGERRNNAQVASAKSQMDFQERMSSTAHQRQVKDLRAAGLNPILSAKYGGASSPGGAQAQITDSITPAVSSALQTRSVNATVEQQEQNVKNLKAQSRLTFAEEQKRHKEMEVMDEQILKIKEEVNNLFANTGKAAAEEHRAWRQAAVLFQELKNKGIEHINLQKMGREIDSRTAQNIANTSVLQTAAKRAMIQLNIDQSTYGKALLYIDRMLPTVKTGGDLVNTIVGLRRILGKKTFESFENIIRDSKGKTVGKETYKTESLIR